MKAHLSWMTVTGRTAAAGKYRQTVCQIQQQDSVLAAVIQVVGKQISRSRVGRQGTDAEPHSPRCGDGSLH